MSLKEIHKVLLRRTLTPFLFTPLLKQSATSFLPSPLKSKSRKISSSKRANEAFANSSASETNDDNVQIISDNIRKHHHLDPSPDSYYSTPFADSCTITIKAGDGGNGCVSFLREKYIEQGPANGGDGGSGGNVYIQAVPGLTSLHKLSRRGELRASKGRNGRGKGFGGKRGDDVVITVPVGTVVKEVSRYDPVTADEEDWAAEEVEREERQKEEKQREAQERIEKWNAVSESVDGKDNDMEERPTPTPYATKLPTTKPRSDKWVLYPSEPISRYLTSPLPRLPEPRRPNLHALQPETPIFLDLDKPMEKPMLLAAGAMGGLGNAHFVHKNLTRPKIATKGSGGVKLCFHLELKLLADVGLVGLPNAGKSTLLRAISNSRTRIGDWAFTTLQPSIGTVVLDDHKGRPKIRSPRKREGGLPRTGIMVADIPGIVEGAHDNKGLGLGFLRHIERAAILALVIDLSQGCAVTNVKNLWHEMGEYDAKKEQERLGGMKGKMVTWSPATAGDFDGDRQQVDPPVSMYNTAATPTGKPISMRPWFVVASKADLTANRDNFAKLQAYLNDIMSDEEKHPSGRERTWKGPLHAVPISALRGEGVDQIPKVIVNLMDT